MKYSSSVSCFCVSRFIICFMLSLFWCVAWAEASPSDVRGSGNVAVKAYTNGAGSFVLWSNGRITSIEGKEVNKETAYDSYTLAKLPSRISGNILGSPKVAVGSFSTEDATYVLFSDGTVKKPRNADAAAPANQGRRLVCGVDIVDGDSKKGSLGWSCRRSKLDYSKWSCFTQEVMEIVFNKSFKSTPVFLYSVDSYQKTATSKRLPSQNFYDCVVSPSRAYIVAASTPMGESVGRLPWHVTFVAFEDE